MIKKKAKVFLRGLIIDNIMVIGKDGRQDGYGKYLNAEGKIQYGSWKSGKRIKWIDEEEYNKAQ